MECIFCKIVSKKIPASLVHETDRLIVIKDAHPQSPTHLLIIPRTHYATMLDCRDADLFGEMFLVATEVAGKLGVDKKGFRLTVNTNAEGGQTVFHMHMHLLAGRALADNMG